MIQTLHIVPEYNEELIYPAICKSMEALNIATRLAPEMKIVIARSRHGEIPGIFRHVHTAGGKGGGTMAARTGYSAY